jgi:hypothetical protein
MRASMDWARLRRTPPELRKYMFGDESSQLGSRRRSLFGSPHASFGFWGLVLDTPVLPDIADNSVSRCLRCLSSSACMIGPLLSSLLSRASRFSEDVVVCVGNRTARSAFWVCSPVGRYLGGKSPIYPPHNINNLSFSPLQPLLVCYVPYSLTSKPYHSAAPPHLTSTSPD